MDKRQSTDDNETEGKCKRDRENAYYCAELLLNRIDCTHFSTFTQKFCSSFFSLSRFLHFLHFIISFRFVYGVISKLSRNLLWDFPIVSVYPVQHWLLRLSGCCMSKSKCAVPCSLRMKKKKEWDRSTQLQYHFKWPHSAFQMHFFVCVRWPFSATAKEIEWASEMEAAQLKHQILFCIPNSMYFERTKCLNFKMKRYDNVHDSNEWK